MLKVFGHLNPDTDTVASAIVYAWLLNTKQPATPYILGGLNKETVYVLERFKVTTPGLLEGLDAGDEVVIVDTNNPDELPDTLALASVVEIIDHHKLFGGITTVQAITVTMRPLASTASIITERLEGVELPTDMAGLLLSALISDTLNLTSPTTTDFDRAARTMLAEKAGVNVQELADAMFAAKSDLSGMSARDILTMDSKVFTFGGKKVRVSSLETTKPDFALGMKDVLVSGMEALKQEEGLDGLFFFIVDIIQSEAYLLASSEFEVAVAEQGFGATFSDGILNLPGVVSRKKQIVPVLEAAIGS